MRIVLKPSREKIKKAKLKNLLVVYWAVLKKGSVDGKYDIKPAIHVLGKNVGRKLTQGYEERIRNAIAHGQVTYRGTDIKYGPKDSDYSIYPSEFLMLFDELVQSINAMMLGVLLFICHQESHSFKSLQLPPRLITLLASAVIDQKFVEVIGSYESTVSLAGKQLHIGIRTEFLSREFLLYTAAILSYNLLVRGANGYERYLFEVDNSKKISSLMIVLPQNFRVLLDEEASIERLNEIFGDTQLLWHDEHKLIRSYKMWRRLFASRIKIFQQAQHQRIFANNTHHIKRQYRIRSVDNKSVSGKVRVEVTAVLKNFTDSSNRQALRKIIKSVTDEVRNKLVLSTFGGIDPYFGIPSRPAQIWVYLYRLDNTLRSINKGGWHGGNLVAIGERIYGNANVYQPVFVKNPEEIWQGIRLRYSIDPNFLHPVS